MEEYNINISVTELQSLGDTHLSDHVLSKIRECREYFTELSESLEVVDSISNPTGIYKYVKKYSRQNGTHYYYDFETDKDKKRVITEEQRNNLGEFKRSKYAYSHYTPNDPNEYVIVITDHLSLLQTEAGASTLHESMTRMSAEYARKNITKHFKYVFVGIQQQSSDKEKLQFTNTGSSIDQKLEPSLDGLGDNKLTQRDALVILGLFAPDRYGIKQHLGYNVSKLRDNYRCLIVLKNRIGKPNLKLGLYFNGMTNYFEELPSIMTDQNYENYKK
tara:strand:+ start:399 stop:1223 length:825 start_codon:yes stop_codon:yes gene_type:complete